MLKVGDSLWHPLSLDIIEFKVVSKTKYKKFTHYNLKAVHKVGACGRLEVIVHISKKRYWFVELVNEENIEYASGLQDFIEGEYYANKVEAQLKFHKIQLLQASINRDRQKRLYDESIARHSQVEALVVNFRKLVKELKLVKE